MIRRLGVGALCALVIFALSAPPAPAGADSGDKQLARVKGEVGYRPAADQPFKPVFGRQDLADDAIAETHAGALGSLTLRDSSEIEIGANTSVQVGAFNTIASGNPNVITLNRGALHFNVRHPSGAQSNYKFTTTTSQIAVRGTEGYLVTGPNGTQLACVSCAPGDVTVTTGSTTTTLVSGQTLTVTGTSPTVTTNTAQVTPNTTTNNPQINQFTPNNINPFIGVATQSALVDPTILLTHTAAIAGGTIAAGAAVAAVTTAAVIQADQPKSTPVPTVSTPTPTPIGSAFVISPTQLIFDAVPQTQSLMISQANATNAIGVTVACTMGATVTLSAPTVPATGGSINVTAVTPTTTTPPAGTHPCTITVSGNGQTATVPVDISSFSTGITTVHRRKL